IPASATTRTATTAGEAAAVGAAAATAPARRTRPTSPVPPTAAARPRAAASRPSAATATRTAPPPATAAPTPARPAAPADLRSRREELGVSAALAHPREEVAGHRRSLRDGAPAAERAGAAPEVERRDGWRGLAPGRRPGGRLAGAGRHLPLHRADLDLVAVGQRGLVDRCSVDARPFGRTEIDDGRAFGRGLDDRVHAAHRRMIERQVRARQLADLHHF